MQNKVPEKNTVEGVVDEALPNALFRVTLTTPRDTPDAPTEPVQVLAYLAGKMRMHRIKVLVGDTVRLELDPYGGKARINKRM